MISSKHIYGIRKKRFEKLLIKQNRFVSRIMVFRLITFLLTGLLVIYFYLMREYYLLLSIAAAGTILFTYLVHIHGKILYNKEIVSYLCKINDESIMRVEGLWNSFQDNGEDFINEEHNYTKDLDIFGKNSLFQCINCANTSRGRKKLKESLSSCKYSIGEILERQRAVKELGCYVSFRQRLNAEGLKGRDIGSFYEDTNNLSNTNDKKFIKNKMLKVLLYVLPSAFFLTFAYYLATKDISYRIPLAFLALNISILIPTSKETNKSLNSVYEYKNTIFAYYNMIKVIEKKNFNSKLLINLRERLINDKKESATVQIKRLAKLVNIISDRRNMFSIALNILFLWDLQCLLKLQKWISRSGKSFEKWIDTIGEFEEISSLSILSCDNPTWIMPELDNESMIFKARGIGHPLLKKGRVCNDFLLNKDKNIILITGSNMSGKSTLLRTSGINLVLAYAGSVVCAESFKCSLMNIYTCMRVSDNLDENISSFYAELLRIKKLMQAVSGEESVFFLLDEIFKGTNSIDRHTAAMSLMVKLAGEKVLGFVSTHDLELGELEKTNRKIRNYHFREYYSNDKIHFDYKLRPGISNTRNALFLMRMSGIEI